MINSIPKIDSKELNKFGQFSTNRLPSDYWLPAKDSVEISKPVEDEKNKEQEVKSEEIPKVAEDGESLNKITITTPDKARKTKDLRTIGLSIAAATVFAAATIFTFLSGGPKGLSKHFGKLRNYCERQLLNAKLENAGKMPVTSKIYVYIIKSLDSLSKKAEAINNFTTFKDLMFKKIMGVSKYLEKAHNKITRLFEKIGRKAVKGNYTDTAGNLLETSLLRTRVDKNLLKGNSYDLVEINGVRLSRAEWLAKVEKLSSQLDNIYVGSFSDGAQTQRYLRLKRAAVDLQQSFASLKVFWSKDFFTQFMAESKIVKEKEFIQKLVHNARKQISYSNADMYQDTSDLIMRMTGAISFKDAHRIRQLQMIKTDIRTLASGNVQDAKLRIKILKNIDSFTSDLKSAIRNEQIDKGVGQELLSNITELNGVVANYKQGKIEDILQIYKAILPKDEYLKIQKSYKNVIKSLDKSVRLETDEFVSKLRDLALGSAPTDVLTMLGAVGLLGYQIGKSENNDERLSITLKYGIPALLGQVGVTLYCNAKLYAGTKSLLMGTISGLLLNRLGEYADDKFKAFKGKNKMQPTISTVEESKIVKNPTETV